jgi:translation initiation factor IF-2
VIYQLTEDIQQALIGMLAPERVEEVLGEAEVRQTFRVSRIGTIAGCMVTQGVIQRGAQARLLRDGTIIHDGRIATLKRFQEDVREVQQGFECGLTLEGYNDVKEGDVLEVYAVREVARSA